MVSGTPVDADECLVLRPYPSLAPGPDLKGRALFPRGRRSEFRFPTEAPGQPTYTRTREGGTRWIHTSKWWT